MNPQVNPFPKRPFRFGVQLKTAADGNGWHEQARRIEGHGYDVATMPDHFDDQFAPVPGLQAVLSATTTLRACALVFDNDYRHPLVLAKELATMDVLSGGRLEIGLGAGWMVADYEQAGMTYDRAGVRVDRFVEGLAVIKGLMGAEPFTYEGDHYTIQGHDGFPKPLQTPHPPVIIGGGGKRVLGIAAREADIVGVNATLDAGVIGPEAIATMTREAVVDKLAILASAADAAGRIDEIELNIRTFFVSVTDDRAGRVAAMAELIGVQPQMIDESPYALIGSVDQIADDLVARREEYGFSYVIVGGDEADAFAPVVAKLADT
ncbi:TIGR03621 family F420-dependent LLM class oxidoreductase [Ilumatobacter nonamiensis]|uniref:TIGR03621 family F420-dependent LLM class oxidoreductase n=1 Tax=Ilumatobacter nonamiensis TaxID=467093 RepID=UPI000346BC5B|nr:TIGR03621 family F420-dependent LLM class oxidoreductase [Ilumatobacter nonamiensis]